MPSGFTNIHYHRDSEGILESEEIRAKAAVPDSQMPVFANDESAARFYLSRALAREGLLEAAEADRPEIAPDFRLEEVREQPLMNTRTVRFQQTRASVPVFGATAVLKLDASRDLVSMDVERAEGPEDVSPMPALGPAEALRRIAEFTSVEIETLARVQPPALPIFTTMSKMPGTSPISFSRCLLRHRSSWRTPRRASTAAMAWARLCAGAIWR